MNSNYKIGDRIQNRWEVHKILKGGMGLIYFVYDHEIQDAFAVKTIDDEMVKSSPNAATRFTQEAVAWVNLDWHPNVTAARMVRTINGKPYIFLELVTGGDLNKWIGTSRLTNNLFQVLSFSLQFCDGMVHAHSKGVRVHRDIKPGNCLITEDDELKVTDFGLAKAFDVADAGPNAFLKRNYSGTPGHALGLTQTGFGLGTCSHMSPEQFDDAKRVETSADVYSFGVMLYQMVTGKLPFVGRTWQDFERQHKTERPPPIKSQNQNLDRLIFTCLEKAPGNRFQDFGSVRAEFVKICNAVGKMVWPPRVGGKLRASDWCAKGASLSFLGRPKEAVACYRTFTRT